MNFVRAPSRTNADFRFAAVTVNEFPTQMQTYGLEICWFILIVHNSNSLCRAFTKKLGEIRVDLA